MTTSTPARPPRRRIARTRQMNIRMDIELWAALEAAAEADRRTTASMLQKFVADGLERWKLEGEVRASMLQKYRRLGELSPQEVSTLIRSYERLIAHAQQWSSIEPLPVPRRRRPKPRQR